ncbi:MAG: putative glycoside hydrolase, partial [Steroidobacteraceae bacterium]
MLRTRHLALAVLLAALPCLALSQTSSSSSAYSPPFPRLAGIDIGGPFNYNDPSYQAALAKENLVILTDYPGLAPGGESMDSIIKSIKALNPKTLVFLYTIDNWINPSDAAYAPLIQKLDSMGWWLYPVDKGGTPISGGGNLQVINNTMDTARDSSGEDSVDWLAHYFVSTIYQPNSSADGLFMDNMFWQPTVNGDWTLGGANLSNASAQAGAALRDGYQRYIQDLRKLMPGKLQIGNIATWGQPQAVLTQYQGLLDGGVMEGLIGASYSVESYGGWQAMMAYYQKSMAALDNDQLGIFGQEGSPTDYQSMRYGLASCLMGNAYYNFSDQSAEYHGVVWFDEFNANLGQAISPPPTAAWQKGVWRRDFQNGIALVNPKGNGTQTVTLETSYVKL